MLFQYTVKIYMFIYKITNNTMKCFIVIKIFYNNKNINIIMI